MAPDRFAAVAGYLICRSFASMWLKGMIPPDVAGGYQPLFRAYILLLGSHEFRLPTGEERRYVGDALATAAESDPDELSRACLAAFSKLTGETNHG